MKLYFEYPKYDTGWGNLPLCDTNVLPKHHLNSVNGNECFLFVVCLFFYLIVFLNFYMHSM